MNIVPITLKAANEFVGQHHRHHKPVPGAKFSVGVQDAAGNLRGVAIAGRPVARTSDDGLTLEVLRVCTDGYRNACSALYGACRRVARGMGYLRMITYTLPEEGGASLKAAGLVCKGTAGGGSWSRPSRPRTDSAPTTAKLRWELDFTTPTREGITPKETQDGER